jgi:hypothetical protein
MHKFLTVTKLLSLFLLKLLYLIKQNFSSFKCTSTKPTPNIAGQNKNKYPFSMKLKKHIRIHRYVYSLWTWCLLLALVLFSTSILINPNPTSWATMFHSASSISPALPCQTLILYMLSGNFFSFTSLHICSLFDM